MSGIHTNERYAVVDASGLNIDTYKSLDELLRALVYRTAVSQKYPLDAIGEGEAAMCDALLAYVDGVHAEARQHLIQNYDPKRLRAPEVWPWHDEQSGAVIYPDKWYGFVDSGGLCGSFTGYESAGVAKSFIAREQEVSAAQLEEYFSTQPEDLGGVACCVLSGREYVDRLYALGAPGGSGWDLTDYGHWHELEPQPGDGLLPTAAYELAKRVNDKLMGEGAPLGGHNYFAIREILAAVLREGAPKKHASGRLQKLSLEDEARIHQKLAACPQVSKRTQGYVMGILREVLRGDHE